jgi:hypothetical protein
VEVIQKCLKEGVESSNNKKIVLEGKPSIGLFVSHRIDTDWPVIDNPLHIPLRCGAVYDTRKNLKIAGDDAWDNISSKRIPYGELTVQYWAWKNVEADYYGLCHYRRYLSFADIESPKALIIGRGNLSRKTLDKGAIKLHRLADFERMRGVVAANDIIVGSSFDVQETPRAGLHSISVRGFYDLMFGRHATGKNQIYERRFVTLLLDILKVEFPEYLPAAIDYLEGSRGRSFNCYIMRCDLFAKMCELQYPIMAEFERLVDYSVYPPENEPIRRLPGVIGEILNAIYIHHLELQGSYRIKELPVVFFETPGIKL